MRLVADALDGLPGLPPIEVRVASGRPGDVHGGRHEVNIHFGCDQLPADRFPAVARTLAHLGLRGAAFETYDSFGAYGAYGLWQGLYVHVGTLTSDDDPERHEEPNGDADRGTVPAGGMKATVPEVLGVLAELFDDLPDLAPCDVTVDHDQGGTWSNCRHSITILFRDSPPHDRFPAVARTLRQLDLAYPQFTAGTWTRDFGRQAVWRGMNMYVGSCTSDQDPGRYEDNRPENPATPPAAGAVSQPEAIRLVARVLGEMPDLPPYIVTIRSGAGTSPLCGRPGVDIEFRADHGPPDRFPAVARIAEHLGLPDPDFTMTSSGLGIYAADGMWQGMDTEVWSATSDRDPVCFEDAVGGDGHRGVVGNERSRPSRLRGCGARTSRARLTDRFRMSLAHRLGSWAGGRQSSVMARRS
jgi:hypothetical protein